MIWRTHILKSDGVFRQRHARICQIYSDVLMLSKIILGRDFRLNSTYSTAMNVLGRRYC